MAIRAGRFASARGPALRSLLSAALVVASMFPFAVAPVTGRGSALDRLAGPATPAELQVMTYNLRFGGFAAPNSWTERRPVMRTLLTTERPDLIGTQEGLAAQLDDIRTDLGRGYDYIGTGRLGGRAGEFMAIFYRTQRLTPQASGDFWLSGTPEVPGSETWGGFAVRMVTWVRFLDRTTGKLFYAVNTHLDNASEHARRQSARLIHERLQALAPPLPIVLTGDFNTPAQPDSFVYGRLVGRAGYQDTWDAATERGTAYGTFHGYQPLVPDGPRIDWVLVTPGVTVSAALTNTFHSGRQFPSDHLPVQVRLRLP
ncbi:endonuclease [Paractinoplanes abujensis]|uniref:Endonuclease/exonuclease/phosphatase family metal-dependent hydrolase n=1 Tax=Paractinoplanes abujensis TaxID=882441 RepID=A0A7W7FZW7_9ACTN|nr:endonuclease/exonuclease/phosphatase family protein [Actinoplanes abujensis]MBB4691012.1 endonuclease/exonuclease/phosphatase family metal-dependent hydrolase [Actinoplanes abujensis]GID17575.1 endonuclease [Actinoplanes abujensis]